MKSSGYTVPLYYGKFKPGHSIPTSLLCPSIFPEIHFATRISSPALSFSSDSRDRFFIMIISHYTWTRTAQDATNI